MQIYGMEDTLIQIYNIRNIRSIELSDYVDSMSTSSKTEIDIWFPSFKFSIIVNKAALANSILGISLFLSNGLDIEPDISNVTA